MQTVVYEGAHTDDYRSLVVVGFFFLHCSSSC